MTNYNVTIGYKAIISINVKAADEEEAKKLAIEKMKKSRDKMRSANVILEDDNFKADGIVDMDATWNQF